MKTINGNAVVMGVTSNQMFAVANIIINVEKNNPGMFEKYIIYHMADDSVGERDQKALAKITSKAELRTFQLPFEGFGFKFGLKSYPPIIYSKIMLFELIREFEFVLWLDTDILVRGDLSKLLECQDFVWRPTSLKMIDQIDYPFATLTPRSTKPNGGVIGIRRNENTLKVDMNACYEIIPTIPKFKKGGGYDEALFGIIAVKNNLHVLELPGIYNNVLQMNNTVEEPIIVHAMGKSKFWNDRLLSVIYAEWKEADKIWRNAGGTPYEKNDREEEDHSFTISPANTTQLFRMIRWNEYWKKCIDYLGLTELGLDVGEYNNYFVQFYIKNLDNKIHYELISREHDVLKIEQKKETIIVALHIEAEQYNEKNTFEILSKLLPKYKAVMKENKMTFECVALRERSMKLLKALVEETYDYIISAYG